MTESPAGTVTLLFTDIEGSTKLIQRAGDRYPRLLDEHKRLLRRAFAAHGGHEVDTAGDGFFVSFPSAQHAVAAAADAQLALARNNWPEDAEIRVRIGIHTGEPGFSGGTYVGLDVHRAARIMAAGHGGQVLLSEATRRLLGDGVQTIPLGEHRLKDLLQPEPLYQLRIAELPSDFPALKTLGNRPNNFPVQANPLIGREAEVAEVAALLRNESSRLVTLTGTGGLGKTRLALQVGAEVLEGFSSGVFFVSLAPVSDPRLVIPTIAQTLAVREVPGEELQQTLSAYLEDKELLLVIDNFEQVIEAATPVTQLLEHCPKVQLLVTSRERLRVASERVYPLPPLEDEAAVALFATRASAASGAFALSEDNVAEVGAICRRLDRLPLAIELAAARTPVLTPRALLERLGQRLPLLTTATRDASERHQTLRRTIEWSYDLLTEPERTLFGRLGVFMDGCRFDAAEAVCGSADVLAGLSSLVDKSLVRQRADPDGQPRFWMFETIREFALERLVESGDLEAIQSAHAQHFASFVHDVVDGSLTISEELELLARERSNIHGALTSMNERSEAVLLAGAVAGLWRFWLSRGPLEEGLRWAQAALARRSALDVETLVGLLVGSSELFRFAGDLPRAKALKQECLEMSRQFPDRVRSRHGSSVAAHTLADLADIAMAEGEVEQAHTYLEESKALGGGPRTLASLGDILVQEGDLERARSCYEDALEGFAAAGHSFNHAAMLESLGEIARRSGDAARAAEYFCRALREFVDLGDEGAIAECLADLAAIAAAEGDDVRAGRLVRVAAEFRLPGRTTDAAMDQLNGLPQDAIEAGQLLTLEEAVQYALEVDPNLASGPLGPSLFFRLPLR